MTNEDKRQPPKKGANLGKWAEAQVSDWLEARSSGDYHFAWHRYPDAHAARGALSSQPADFLVARKITAGVVEIRRDVWHLEVKETAELKRLPKAKVGQYGKLKMFYEAGIIPYVLIYRSMFKDWYLMSHLDLFQHDECPASFPFDGRKVYDTPDPLLESIFR